jgi:hypothetical protein
MGSIVRGTGDKDQYQYSGHAKIKSTGMKKCLIFLT